uniref:Uncharacterized protein n=1 Tax=Physcomitrium patens TaxID=3218 RepID=A0A2K1IMP8_PHYPA|nr:hypothetical protein PHYPA_026868 [Physcomitrium patens]
MLPDTTTEDAKSAEASLCRGGGRRCWPSQHAMPSQTLEQGGHGGLPCVRNGAVHIHVPRFEFRVRN